MTIDSSDDLHCPWLSRALSSVQIRQEMPEVRVKTKHEPILFGYHRVQKKGNVFQVFYG